jgi:hypothetical protein
MLGGMEEDPKVGDPPLAELAGLQFGLLSNEDTLAMSVFEKNQNIIGPKTLWDSRLGVYFLTGDGSRCSSCGAFTKDSCDGMRANMVFCSTRVLAYPSSTFNHPSANWRIFVACV